MTLGVAARDHVNCPFRLDGRTALVTGASSGLGRHFCAVLAEAGAHVVAVARRRERLDELAADLNRVVPMAGDIASASDRHAIVETARAVTGRVDVLVNNAGVPGELRADQETLQGFQRVLDVNLAAAFHLAAALQKAEPAPEESASHGLSVINVSSIVGMVSTAPFGGASYAASKAGLLGLTRELAGQWGRRGVRVNALVPGWFETEMTSELFADERSAAWVGRNTMLGRSGSLGELDGALLFLASQASSYVTGQAIVVDGGWTAR